MAATKKNTKKSSRSNVSKTTKKQSFKFRWWMAVILVLLVAVVGIVIVRFSRASGNDPIYDAMIASNNDARITIYVKGQPADGTVSVLQRSYSQGWETTQYRVRLDNGLVACGQIQTTNFKNISDLQPGQRVKWVVSNPDCAKG